MRPPFYVFFPRFALKHHFHASEPLKKSLSRVFIHNFQLQQQKQQFVIKFKFSLSLEPFGAAAEKQLEVNPFDNLLPQLIMHRLPSVANFTQEKLGFQEGGGHMEQSELTLGFDFIFESRMLELETTRATNEEMKIRFQMGWIFRLDTRRCLS